MTEKTKEFLQKLKESGNWNDNYDYSKVVYKTNRDKIIIIDERGFEHEQRAAGHLIGKKLSIISVVNKNEYFIIKAKEIHGDKYDYSLVEYVNTHSNIKIICPTHGEFLQPPSRHLFGGGCRKCADYENSQRQKFDNTTFIIKANEIHGDKYDYSLVEYVSSQDKIKIICPEHGEFSQIANSHLQGNNCPKCVGGVKSTQNEFIIKAKEIHGDKYDYSLVEYVNSKTKVKLICPNHGEFKQSPTYHLRGSYCKKCTKEENVRRFKENGFSNFIEKAKNIYGDKYDYSKVEYINAHSKVIIIDENGFEHSQSPTSHLLGYELSIQSIIDKNAYFKYKANKIHNYKYNYNKVNYFHNAKSIKIICPIHGEFKQSPNAHISRKQGCPICSNGFTKTFKIDLINELEHTDLLNMDPYELYVIIGQGKLPVEFGTLTNTDAGSDERIVSLHELRRQLEEETTETLGEENEDVIYNVNNVTTATESEEINQVDEVDSEITNTRQNEPRLPSMNITGNLHSLDNPKYATMDKEAFEGLVQYKLRKLWNNVLNGVITTETLFNETGGKYFTLIKDMFFEEYNEVVSYVPADGYSFKFQPNLMQKLTVHRLFKNKYYGNWSGTGAGKTLSFILASRTLNSKLTLIIALNSTIKQMCEVIKEVYPNSKTYTEYNEDMVFDRNEHNYLVLNYEKFQQSKSEELFQSLTNSNKIDFIVIDEVHNAKQTDEGDEFESIRRGVMTRLLGRARENNVDLHVLAMSATPVVNNLYEARSLLTLMTGLEYDDLATRRTLNNALNIFQQLILNGLRFIPKYDIEMTELTGQNMSNLSIEGSHLLEDLLRTSNNNYIETEKMLLTDKLISIQPYLRKGVIIYSYFTTGFINKIEEYVSGLGFKVATYTGEESKRFREENLKSFINGDIDILIGSKPIGTGVDGLQDVCNRMIILTLPWTDSEYTQLKGRIYRQGSKYSDVEIIIPQVKIEFEEGEYWSWDVQRLNLIKNKKTLADAAVDGVVPSRVLPSKDTLYKKAIESLNNWKERINEGKIIDRNRDKVNIDLYPEFLGEDRERRINSELSEFNRRGKITHSAKMNKEFSDNPESWYRYHSLRKSRMETWEEIPYEYIATKINDRRDVVADFGCGENLLRKCIPSNEVYSFDHVAIDDSVIACDMRNTGLVDESIDVAVFSLALWGSNSEEYIKEAYRVLRRKGMIYIAEPSKDNETSEQQQDLIDLIKNYGFQQVGSIENRGKFVYLTGIKI